MLSNVSKLGTLQFRLLKEEVEKKVKKKKVSNILETPLDELVCPHCNSIKFIKWGKRNDLQRYKCKLCQKTFNSLTKTPLARLRRKGHWLDYAECLKKGLTIREAAVVCQIHRNTSFRWRHRFINNLKFIKANELNGIVEMNDIAFRESFKGDKSKSLKKSQKRKQIFVLFNIDRNNNIYDMTNLGFDKTVLNKELLNKIKQDSILISNLNTTYNNFTQSNNLEHITLDVMNKDFVNLRKSSNYKLLFYKWINDHFRGVATKYLENYVSWYRSLKEFRSGIHPLTLLYRAKNKEKYRHQPKKVIQYVL